MERPSRDADGLNKNCDEPGLLNNLSVELNYRLALTLNTLVQYTADSAVGVDSTVNIQLANGSYLTANNIRSAIQQLVNVNARPLYADGMFGGIINPNVVKDVYNDSSINGLTDILKRGDSTREQLLMPLSNEDVVTFAGGKFKQTSTAPSVTISGNTYYNTYIFGDDAMFAVFLGKNPDSGERNYRLLIQEAPANGSTSDPARMIGKPNLPIQNSTKSGEFRKDNPEVTRKGTPTTETPSAKANIQPDQTGNCLRAPVKRLIA